MREEAWPPGATDEERSLRLFKDALTKHVAYALWSFLSPELQRAAEFAVTEVGNAYARVREHAPEELEGATASSHAEILTALRNRDAGREGSLPSRRVLVHVLAGLDHYFFELTRGHERVYDAPDLPDEERAAEHGLRHDLFLKLYDELEPAFDVSLSWPPNGYDVDEKGELVEAEAKLKGMAAVGYDYGYDAAVFCEGHADDEEFVRGFVEGCLDRIAEDEPEEVGFLRNLWKGGDEWDSNAALEMLKDEYEIREGRFDDRPNFPLKSSPNSCLYDRANGHSVRLLRPFSETISGK